MSERWRPIKKGYTSLNIKQPSSYGHPECAEGFLFSYCCDQTVPLHMEFPISAQSINPEIPNNKIVYKKVQSFSRKISRERMRNMKNLREDKYTGKKLAWWLGTREHISK